MSEEEQNKSRGSTAIRLGPGAKNNTFIGMKMNGYENAVVAEGDGVNFPEGNRFIGGEFNRHRSADPAPLQTPPPVEGGFKMYQVGVSIPLQTPPPFDDLPALLPEPWYKQLGIQIASGVCVAVIIALLIWLGLPIKS